MESADPQGWWIYVGGRDGINTPEAAALAIGSTGGLTLSATTVTGAAKVGFVHRQL